MPTRRNNSLRYFILLVFAFSFKSLYCALMKQNFTLQTSETFLPPATKLGPGYVFTRVYDSVHMGGLPHCMLRYPPPGADTHPSFRCACWEIRATSGRYASYRNAILLELISWASPVLYTGYSRDDG